MYLNGLNVLEIPEVEARGQTDRLDIQQAIDIINQPELTMFTSKHGTPDLAAIWLHEEQVKGLEFGAGENVRVKTHGDGPFVCKYCFFCAQDLVFCRSQYSSANLLKIWLFIISLDTTV